MSNSPPAQLLQNSLAQGDLWQRAVVQTERAALSGSLRPIVTRPVTVRQREIRFTVHTLAAQDPKATALARQRRQAETGNRADPFRPPYDPDLFVADISPTHVCVLNKFPVLAHHLLIITRQDEPQTDLLTLADFQALWACLAQVDGLAFYNGGRVAGASQAHKHLQLVPFSGNDGLLSLEERLVRPGGLPFPHAFGRLNPCLAPHPPAAAGAAFAHYHGLLRQVGLGRRLGNPAQLGPYNLLLTRRWMLLIPRSRETVAGIGVNGLGFAGSLLVRTPEEMAYLRRRTPLLLLRDVVARRRFSK